MRRTPIRTRLTAWYALVLAAVLLGLGAFVVTRLGADLTAELDRSLRASADQIALGYHAEGPAEFRDVTRTVLPVPGERGAGAQVLARGGRVVLAEGDPLTRAPLLEAPALARVLAGGRVTVSRRLGRPARAVRITAVPVRRDGVVLALATTESLAAVDSARHRVLVLLLVGGTAGLTLATLGGWTIARRAMRPVERMTSRADEVGRSDLRQRIAVPRVEDEVGHLARTLNAMLDRLEAGVEARERLVADASHELRTPLAAMRSELDVSLRYDALDHAARAVLGSVRDEVGRMARTVDDLLTLARADGGGLEVLPTPQDVGPLLRDAIRARATAARARGVRVALEGGPVVLAVDGERFLRVVGNLLDNAIRFAAPGGDVRVVLWSRGGQGGVTVTDDGPGVPPDARDRVFARFSREDAARGRQGGAGLGLAICREVVRAHGGRVWVQDADPRGSAFVVALPLPDPGEAGVGGDRVLSADAARCR